MRKAEMNEKGQALMMVLFCSVIAFVFVLAILYMITRGTQMSGVQKRYDSALAAANASVAISTQLLDNKAVVITEDEVTDTAERIFESSLSIIPPSGQCLDQKLRLPTNLWSNCSNAQKSLDPRDSSDIQFVLKGNELDYDVRGKIVDSRRGVTAEPPGALQQGGVVNSDGALTPVELPYFYYTVELSAMANSNRKDGEDARITYIYAD